MKLFSKRHQRALAADSLKFALPQRLRGRLWKELCEVNESFTRVDKTNFNYDVWTLEEVEHTLKRIYGTDELVSVDQEQHLVKKGLNGLILAGRPSEVLDAIEACWNELVPERRVVFQKNVNDAFVEESCPWRLSDGEFFRVDSEFLEQHILGNVHALLRTEGFSGAQDEFLDARNELTGGETKDAILKACKSMESVLKVMTGEQSSNASVLLRKLLAKDVFNDVPEEVRNALVEQVLMGLPALRNKLGGHGQGGEVLDVPKPYASLAVHLAAVFNAFLIEKHIAAQPPVKKKPEPAEDSGFGDEIPF